MTKSFKLHEFEARSHYNFLHFKRDLDTPAALIASGTDIKGLFEAFDLKAGAARDGMEWVDAQPKAKDGQLQSVKVGFRQGQLAVLEIVDGLGQRSVLSFSQWQGNAPLKAEQFAFKPPAGADVIRP